MRVMLFASIQIPGVVLWCRSEWLRECNLVFSEVKGKVGFARSITWSEPEATTISVNELRIQNDCYFFNVCNGAVVLGTVWVHLMVMFALFFVFRLIDVYPQNAVCLHTCHTTSTFQILAIWLKAFLVVELSTEFSAEAVSLFLRVRECNVRVLFKKRIKMGLNRREDWWKGEQRLKEEVCKNEKFVTCCILSNVSCLRRAGVMNENEINISGQNSTFWEVKKEKENTVTECRANFFQSFLRKACIYPFLIYPRETTTHGWKHNIGPRIRGEANRRSSWTEPSPVLLDYFTLIWIPTILNLAQVESRVFPRTELISKISQN